MNPFEVYSSEESLEIKLKSLAVIPAEIFLDEIIVFNYDRRQPSLVTSLQRELNFLSVADIEVSEENFFLAFREKHFSLSPRCFVRMY